MTKEELIEEIELLIKANKDNAYCEFEELSNMIKKVCNDTNYMSGNKVISGSDYEINPDGTEEEK